MNTQKAISQADMTTSFNTLPGLMASNTETEDPKTLRDF
jgi:hypothetical protein